MANSFYDTTVYINTTEEYRPVKLRIVYDIELDHDNRDHNGHPKAFVAAWLVDKVDGVGVLDRNAVTKEYEHLICAEDLENEILAYEGYHD
jgi:hypothetical protein